ncbi:curlin, partial [Rhizobium sp. ICMP 5592]|nr:curlin [Rhizobium sp. ICMP 5592]
MTRTIFKTLIAALLAGSIGQAVLPADANAGGWLSVTFAPSNAEDAGALATGLRFYSLYRNIRGAGI